jgi:hypothetical protein
VVASTGRAGGRTNADGDDEMGLIRGLVLAVGGLLAGVVGLLKGVLIGVGNLVRRLV